MAQEIKIGKPIEPPYTKDIEFCQNLMCGFNETTHEQCRCTAKNGQCYGYMPYVNSTNVSGNELLKALMQSIRKKDLESCFVEKTPDNKIFIRWTYMIDLMRTGYKDRIHGSFTFNKESKFDDLKNAVDKSISNEFHSPDEIDGYYAHEDL